MDLLTNNLISDLSAFLLQDRLTSEVFCPGIFSSKFNGIVHLFFTFLTDLEASLVTSERDMISAGAEHLWKISWHVLNIFVP